MLARDMHVHLSTVLHLPCSVHADATRSGRSCPERRVSRYRRLVEHKCDDITEPPVDLTQRTLRLWLITAEACQTGSRAAAASVGSMRCRTSRDEMQTQSGGMHCRAGPSDWQKRHSFDVTFANTPAQPVRTLLTRTTSSTHASIRSMHSMRKIPYFFPSSGNCAATKQRPSARLNAESTSMQAKRQIDTSGSYCNLPPIAEVVRKSQNGPCARWSCSPTDTSFLILAALLASHVLLCRATVSAVPAASGFLTS
jgi:hypothetical protein